MSLLPFDKTHAAIRCLTEGPVCSVDGNERLDCDEVQRFLKELGKQIQDPASFEKEWALMNDDGDDGVDFQEFETYYNEAHKHAPTTIVVEVVAYADIVQNLDRLLVGYGTDPSATEDEEFGNPVMLALGGDELAVSTTAKAKKKAPKNGKSTGDKHGEVDFGNPIFDDENGPDLPPTAKMHSEGKGDEPDQVETQFTAEVQDDTVSSFMTLPDQAKTNLAPDSDHDTATVKNPLFPEDEGSPNSTFESKGDLAKPLHRPTLVWDLSKYSKPGQAGAAYFHLPRFHFIYYIRSL